MVITGASHSIFHLSSLQTFLGFKRNIQIIQRFNRSTICFLFLVGQIPEDDEVFSVRLTAVAGGALLRPNASSVQLRIRRNDSPLRFSHSIMAVPESAGIIALNVTRGRLTEDGPLIGSVDTEVTFFQSSCFFT